MAVDEVKTEPEASDKGSERTCHGVILQTLRGNEIRLVPYVPDRVLTTLIKNIHADPFFTTFPTAREEEAVGIVSGAWMAGMKGAILMQTSCFAPLVLRPPAGGVVFVGGEEPPPLPPVQLFGFLGQSIKKAGGPPPGAGGAD